MGEVIEAIYEKDVLKPLKKLNLKEGEKVRLKIIEIKESLADIIKKYRIKVEEDILDQFIKERR